MARLRAGLALCALIAQLALPFAHEWQVARQEVDHPLAEGLASGSGPRLSDASRSGHSHHDEDLCRLCPALSRLGFVLLPLAAQPGGSSEFHSSLPSGARALARVPCPGPVSPRGPPAA